MIRIILGIIALIAIIYLFYKIKNWFSRLRPELKKQILTFGLSNLLMFFKAKWYWILTIGWRILKTLLRR
ncbi:MAG: hypothetical protein OIF32_00145 [Campylobacterales bacterium]|nr:hypothetical protein [Campylobacterales bacterium]